MLVFIEVHWEALSKAERRVAQWILDHPREAARATLAQLAAEVGTSEPTVIRFCRRVGLRGFRDLTLRLTETLSQPGNYIHRHVNADDPPSEAAGKILDASIQALLKTREQVSRMPLADCVAAVTGCRQLLFMGLGASGYVAQDAWHKFFRLGLPCAAVNDVPSMLQAAAVAQPRDVLLLISSGGAWPDLVAAGHTAADRGATVIALTRPASPLADVAHFLLPVTADEDPDVYTPTSSRLAHLAVVDALLVAVALAQGDRARERLKASKAALQRPTGIKGEQAA